MIGVLLMALSAGCLEIATSIGKFETAHKKESVYAFGFLNGFWVIVFLLISALFIRHTFVFSIASLPTFGARLILEILLTLVSLKAIVAADRSTFTFLRVWTIPLLLGVDLILKYTISPSEMIGIFFILLALVILFFAHGLGENGKLLSLTSAIMAVGTISLYKYDITHFNSVEAEQVLITLGILTTLFITAKVRTGENLFSYLFKPIFFLQSFISGIASVAGSFAMLFAPASVIMALGRSFEILAAIISGKTYFREKHSNIKLVAFACIALGLILISL